MELSDSIEFRPSVHFFRQTFTKKKVAYKYNIHSYISLTSIFSFRVLQTLCPLAPQKSLSRILLIIYFLLPCAILLSAQKLGWACENVMSIMVPISSIPWQRSNTPRLEHTASNCLTKNNLELLRRKDKT